MTAGGTRAAPFRQGVIPLDELAQGVNPARTVLFLGAGASVPSGAPTGAQLAEAVSVELRGRVISADLQELATILERLVGREALVAAVRKQLTELAPSRGLLTLPEFPWHAIYTTNFDRLVELAYRRVGNPGLPASM